MFISGATGQMAPFVNGIFNPTKEKGLDGRVLYAKRESKHSYDETPTVWIEHQMGQWCVKPASGKGKDQNWANVAGGCGLEACTSRVWKVWDGKAQVDAPIVKLVAGAEAQRQVRGGCLHARQHAPPPRQQPPPSPPIPPLPSRLFPCFV